MIATLVLALSPSAASTDAAATSQVLVVAPALGPGVFSTDVQTAVDAASDGDVVLVKGGVYAQGFVVDDKSIVVAAEAGQAVTLQTGVTIRNLAAARSATLQGLEIRGGFGEVALLLQNDAGPVWVDDCTISGGSSTSSGSAGVSATQCASATLQRCSLHGGGGGFSGSDDSGGDGVTILFSSITIWSSDCKGGQGGPTLVGGPATGHGGNGARLNAGSLFAAGTTFGGGDGANPASPFPGGLGGDGLVASAAVTALDCAFAGGSGKGGAANGLATHLTGAGSLAALPGRARGFTASSPVREAQTVSFTANGLPGESAGFLFSIAPDVGQLLVPFSGVLVESLATADAALLGTIPANGSLAVSLLAPNLPPSLQGATLFLQSLFFDAPPTHLVIGPPAALVILDSSL